MTEPGRRWGLDAARVIALVGAVVVHAGWLWSLAEVWGTDELTRRDWWVFWDAGRRLGSGALSGIYHPRPGGFPFLHPPPVITMSAPLGGLGAGGAYAVVLLAQLGGLVASIAALRGVDRGRRASGTASDHDVVWLAALASAPWGISVVLGQPTALLLASWLVGLWAWRDRPLASGLAFSLCVLKPPFLLAPLALALIRRRWRALAGIAAGCGIAFTASLPAGLERWPEWIAAASGAMRELDAGGLALWKQHTALAFLRSVAPASVAWPAWILVALPLGAWTLWRLRDPDRGALRTGAAMGLATIALGPYAYFYDALLLALPAAALWLDRARYPRTWLAPLALIGLGTFAAQHVGFLFVQRGPAVAGALATLWLALELAAPVEAPD